MLVLVVHGWAMNELEGQLLHAVHTVLALEVQLLTTYWCTAHALHALHTVLALAVHADAMYSV